MVAEGWQCRSPQPSKPVLPREDVMKNEDDIEGVGGFGNVQHNLRVEQAYKKGKDRQEAYQRDPSHPGGPRDDGYEHMSPDEKEAYKRGHRGD
jgi:hypothetical protein